MAKFNGQELLQHEGVCVPLLCVRGDQIDALRPTGGQIADREPGYTHVRAIIAVEACKSGFEQTGMYQGRFDGDLFGCWSGAFPPDRCDSRRSRASATHVCPPTATLC